MNHRTPIEDFRARIAALSREQLIEAMHYLRGYNSFAMDRALELVTMPVTATPAVLPRVHVHLFGQDGICTLCDLDIVTWSQEQDDAELEHIATEGTLS